MKFVKRIFAALLAVLMLPVVAVPAVAAELATYGEQNFEKIAVGKKLSMGDGLGGVPAYSSVGEDAGGNRFAHIPFIGGENSGNWDQSLTAKHASLSNGESFTFEVSYRPHYNPEIGGAEPTVEAQFYKYNVNNPSGKYENGVFMNLYTINLATGKLTGCGTIVEGAKGFVADAWNTVKMVFYPNNCSFKLYVNDELYSVQTELPVLGSSLYYGGCTNAVIGSNQLIVAKCNKNKGAYVSEANAEDASYIDVDNIRVYETEKVRYTLNGEEKTIGKGSILNLAEGGKKLLWAKIEKADGSTYTVNDALVSIEDGMKIDAAVVGFASLRAEARVCKPLGLRFVTQVNLTDLAALQARENIARVEMGTLIVPKLSVGGIGKVTFDIVKMVGHITIPMQEWYSIDEAKGEATFAGSLVNIKEENYNRAFSGVGYMKIIFSDDSEMVIYASERIDNTNTTSITAAAKRRLSTGVAYGEPKDAMKYFEEKYEGDVMKLYGEDLKGLNVLALGDSLFAGTIGYKQSTQWVNKLGLECGWNLTNLGIGSMTVSWTERNNVSQFGSKNSMYDWYFNNKNDFRWGTKAVGVSPNPYFNCGDISGNAEDVDLIIFEGGCNDYGTAIGAPLGTVDSMDPATFLGAWNCITERLMEDYPNATIVFLTSWRLAPQSRHLDSLSSIEYSESVIKLYNEKYSDNPRIALIDAGNPSVSGVDMLNAKWRDTYSTDSYHLKDSGMNVMANNMLPLLWQIAKNTGKID